MPVNTTHPDYDFGLPGGLPKPATRWLPQVTKPLARNVMIASSLSKSYAR